MKYSTLLTLLSSLWLPAIASVNTTKTNQPSVKKHLISIRHTWYTSDYYLLGQHFGTADYKNKGYPLGIALSYGLSVGPRNYLGANLSFERQTGRWNNEYMGYSYKYGITAMSYPVGNFTRNSLTLAAEYTHAYIAGKHLRLYTTIGMGITVYKVDLVYDNDYYTGYNANKPGESASKARQKRDGHFNAYYAPFGISVGGNISWFAEVGFGYKGLMNTGVSYVF